MAAAATASAPSAATFRKNTRKRFVRTRNPLSFSSFNQQATTTFDQVGYVNCLYLYHSFSLTDTAGSPSVAAAAEGKGPWSLIKRITLNTNLGTSVVYDVDGYQAHVISKLFNRDIQLDVAYGTADTVDPLYAYPVSSYSQNVAKTINFCHIVPVALNDGDQFSIGTLNLQAPEISAQLAVTTGAPSDILNTADTLTLSGTTTVYQEYFEVPPATNRQGQKIEQPKRILSRYITQRVPITTFGETAYIVPREGKLLRLIQSLTLNGALDSKIADMTQMKWIVNGSDYVETRDAITQLVEYRRRYGKQALPLGTYVWDYYIANGNINASDLRDVYDTIKLSVIESRVNISNSATLGTGNNYLDTTRHLLQGY